jgi:hypothetical protein
MLRRRVIGALAILWGLPGLWPAGTLAASLVSEADRAWIERAGELVEAADSGRAEALQFRREVQESREILRELVRSADPEDRARYQNKILMVALLDAAAACHRGGYIVCPPDLMRQMRAQLARLQAQIGVVG